MEGDHKGDFRGNFKQYLEGDLLSSSSQLRSRSGLVQVPFSLELKFNSLELYSEVGRLVFLFFVFFNSKLKIPLNSYWESSVI